MQAKAVPFKAAILEYWDRLRNARGELDDLGGSLRKEKWDDLSYFRVQDACIERVDSRPALAVTQLALIRAGHVLSLRVDGAGIVVCRVQGGSRSLR